MQSHTQPPNATLGAQQGEPDWHQAMRTRIQQAMQFVENKDYDAVTANWAEDGVQTFNGHHALGGKRRGIKDIAAWYHRCGRLLPGLKFTLRDIWISGTPGDSAAVVRWDSVAGTASGGTFENRGMHVIRMVGGKCIEQDMVCDSQMLAEVLDEFYKGGVEEAGAPPINSR